MAKNKQEKFELFLDNGEKLISLGFFCYLENMWEFISTYCKDVLHFTPHYYRQWVDANGNLVIDFGSHTKFFKINYHIVFQRREENV